jgi:phosphoribosylformylglycinamidine (FGAM) synthase PurS component
MIVEMIVSLKIPDNLAITAFNTLMRMEYKQLKKLERSDYYKFDVKANVKEFKDKICNVDMLVNANKHEYNFKMDNNKTNKKNIRSKRINVLIQDIDNGAGLLSTLKERLGFDNINELEKGTLWTMYFDKNVNGKKTAIGITKSLLMNDNFQRYKLL